MNISKKTKILIGLIISIVLISFILLTIIFDFNCPFLELFHVLCPFCGTRTMIVNILELKIIDAFIANPFMFIFTPCLILLLFIKYILNKNININKYHYIFILIIMVLFTIIRNII